MSTDGDGPHDCGPEQGASADALDEMWRGQLRWWHGFFAILVVTTVVVMLAEDKQFLGLRIACVVAIGAAYAVWGRRGMGERDERAGFTYLAIAWGLMILLMALDGTGTAWILSFGLFPQTWAILPRT